MTVKEVFELRKQGRIEEAYEAIRPMYAVHQGKYTTLCMFWVGSDMLKKRLAEEKEQEAVAIFKALIRVLPKTDDHDGRCRLALMNHLLRLAEQTSVIRVLDYIEAFPLQAVDWESSVTSRGFVIEAIAEKMFDYAFYELQQAPTVDNALLMIPLLQNAMNRNPHNERFRRCMSLIYQVMGEDQKAAAILPKPLPGWLKKVLPFE